METYISSENIIYIIIHYNFEYNLFELIENVELFCFSFCCKSQKNSFNIYIVYNNLFTILFPKKLKDNILYNSCNFNEIKDIIEKNRKNFFDFAQNILNTNIENINSPFNQILKKIILENNYLNDIKKKEEKETIKKDNLIILISDCINSNNLNFNQKLLYLLKKNNISIDCIHLGNNNEEYNSIFKSICTYTNGIFENIEINEDNNLFQYLIQEFLPLPGKYKLNHKNIEINNNYDKITCDKCKNNFKEIFYSCKNNLILCKECYKSN